MTEMQRVQAGVADIHTRLTQMETSTAIFEKFVRDTLMQILAEAKTTNGRLNRNDERWAEHDEYTRAKKKQIEAINQKVEELYQRIEDLNRLRYMAIGASAAAGGVMSLLIQALHK
jgi:DNA repair exonuclease SbcCD ATPase subunit